MTVKAKQNKEKDFIQTVGDKNLIADCYFQFSEKTKVPIHVKEMEVIWFGLQALEEHVQNQHVTLYCDNKSVCAAFKSLGAKDLRSVKFKLFIFTIL